MNSTFDLLRKDYTIDNLLETSGNEYDELQGTSTMSVTKEEYILHCLMQSNLLTTQVPSAGIKEQLIELLQNGNIVDSCQQGVIQSLIGLLDLEEFHHFLDGNVISDFDTRMMSTDSRERYYSTIYSEFDARLQKLLAENDPYDKICDCIDELETSLLQTFDSKERFPLAYKIALRLISGEMKLRYYSGESILVHVTCPVFDEGERLHPFSGDNLYGESSAELKIAFLKRISNNPNISCHLVFSDDQSTHTAGLDYLRDLAHQHPDLPIDIIELDSCFDEAYDLTLPHLHQHKRTESDHPNISRKSGACTHGLFHAVETCGTDEYHFYVQVDTDNSIPIQNIGHHISTLVRNPDLQVTQGTRKAENSIRFIPEGEIREWLSYLQISLFKLLFPAMQNEGPELDPNHGITVWRGTGARDYIDQLLNIYQAYGHLGIYDVYPWQLLRYVVNKDLGVVHVPTVCLDSPHKSHFPASGLGTRLKRVLQPIKSMDEISADETIMQELEKLLEDQSMLDTLVSYFDEDREETEYYALKTQLGMTYPHISEHIITAIQRFSNKSGN